MRTSFFIIICSIIFGSCTSVIDVKIPDPDPKIVVEGFIDIGETPYVLLTRNSPFYDTINASNLQNYFVSGATVKMFDGTDTVAFQELTFDTAGVQASIYIGIGAHGEIGKTYQLFVEADGQQLHASTSILQPLPLDSVWYTDAPADEPDSLVQLMVRYSDPPAPGNHVRYFTKRNSESFMPGYNSVFDDALVNGTTFDFPLDRGVDRNNDSTYIDYGYFYRGDTVIVKWSAIDFPHFNFWKTIEFELGGSGNPFAAPVKIQSNVENGLGIWGGYSSSFDTVIIQ